MPRPVQIRFFPPLVVFALAAACFAPRLLGQTPPAPAAADVLSGLGQPDSTEGITTLHAHTDLVVIDVVVTDSSHTPIHDLKESDFTLLENNKPQRIRNFEEHRVLPDNSKVEPALKLPPGLFTNKSPAPASGPVNVLLLDYLNTPLDAQPYARKQLLDYLNKAPAGTRIAIFGLTTSLSMLQGFTSDPAVLKAALTMKKGAPQASQILSDPVNGGPVGDSTLSEALSGPTAVTGMVTSEMVDDINRFEALESSFQEDIRAKYTLAGFQLLARYLVGIPGRKNVIWFSGSFPLNVEPNANEADPNDSVVRNDEELRTTDNLLTRAQVAVYPVDARGVFTDPSQSVTAANTDITVDSGATAADATLAFMTQTAQEHETMSAMAEETGGEVFINTNNLSQAVAKAIEDGSNYYTLTYTPANSQWDGRFRAIKVKVDNPGVKLSYRNGYYADDPNDRSKLIAGESAMASTPANTMSTAMMHGGPNPAEILFKVRVRPASTPPEDTPIKSNRTNPNPKVKVDGPFREYGVDLVPDAHAVSCPAAPPAGNHRCALEVATYIYDRYGQLLITADNTIHATLTPADYAKLQVSGMAFHQEISVPVKGEYYLRTAIHDLISDRVGAVEVPVAAVARLDPLQPLPPSLERDPAPAATAPAGAAGQTPTDAPPADATPPPASAPGAAPVAEPVAPAATPR